jgi:hypothetical protein
MDRSTFESACLILDDVAPTLDELLDSDQSYSSYSSSSSFVGFVRFVVTGTDHEIRTNFDREAGATCGGWARFRMPGAHNQTARHAGVRGVTLRA